MERPTVSSCACFLAHGINRSTIPFAVACVGSPKKIPPASVRFANSCAPASAASVFPIPIGASKIKMPGFCVSILLNSRIV